MTVDIRDKKFSLIELIMSVEDTEVLEAIEREINRISKEGQSPSPDINKAIRPIRRNVTLSDIDKEQNYTAFDYQEFRVLADQVGLEEPIEELLEALGD